MQFDPVPARALAARLVQEIQRGTDPTRPGRLIGIDGPDWSGAGELADQVAEAWRAEGGAVRRVRLADWQRAASLRLEFGLDDPTMLLHGWYDDAAVVRELISPLHTNLPVLLRLRDPDSDRPYREPKQLLPAGTVVVLDGPFLAAPGYDLDLLVHLQMSPAARSRRLPTREPWWETVFARYEELQPGAAADVVVAWDHPGAPALLRREPQR